MSAIHSLFRDRPRHRPSCSPRDPAVGTSSHTVNAINKITCITPVPTPVPARYPIPTPPPQPPTRTQTSTVRSPTMYAARPRPVAWLASHPLTSTSILPSPAPTSFTSARLPHRLRHVACRPRHPTIRRRDTPHATGLSPSSGPDRPPGAPPPSPANDPRGINGTLPFYVALVAAQALPFIFPHSGVAGDLTYFTTTAVAALIIGCRRAPLEPLQSQPISKTQAIAAPFAASTFLFGSYLLLKYTTVNIGAIFNGLTTFAGTLCLKEALDPVFHSALSLAGLQDLVLWQQNSPPPTAEGDNIEPASLSLGPALASVAAIATTVAYLSHVEPTFVFSNMIALGICARVVSLVRPDSFVVAAGLLCGLFFYDIFWVFGSEVMVSVATQIDSPGKLLFPRDVADVASSTVKYPYAILGLGDVCIPGIFVSLAQAMDSALVQVKKGASEGDSPYFVAAVAAYGAGLLSCFVANLTTHVAQPALLYLVPALILSSLGMGSARGELNEVIGFKVKTGAEETQE